MTARVRDAWQLSERSGEIDGPKDQVFAAGALSQQPATIALGGPPEGDEHVLLGCLTAWFAKTSWPVDDWVHLARHSRFPCSRSLPPSASLRENNESSRFSLCPLGRQGDVQHQTCTPRGSRQWAKPPCYPHIRHLRMHERNTPGVGTVLTRYGLTFLPEAIATW